MRFLRITPELRARCLSAFMMLTVVAAILAGIVATHVATIIGFWLPAVGLPKLDWPSVNGGVFTPYGSAIQQFVSGSIFHYTDGVVFTVVFAH